MPRLLLFGLCQKAIIDRQEGAVSMIALIGKLRIQTDSEAAEFPNSTVPIPWSAVASWVQEQDDGEKLFQTKIELYLPSGELKFTADGQPFVMNDWSIQSLIMGFGLPYSEQGVYTVKLFLREDGVEDWNEVSSYPFHLQIIHVTPPERDEGSS